MNRAMSISFCMNIFVALIIARSVRPPVHLISLHILYVCLHVYMLRHIYIYIFFFFAPSLSFASEYFSGVSSRIKFTSFNEFALFLGLNAAR